MTKKKYPWWWRKLWRHKRKLCALGLHVPVRMDNEDGSSEVFCQNCAEIMTLDEWRKFHKK